MKNIILIIASSIIVCLYTSQIFSQVSSVKIIKLNNEKEYVLIKNEGDLTVNLKGWILHDHDYGKANVYSYTFGDVELQAGEILQMQSGKRGKDEEDEHSKKLPQARHYIRWSDRNVWNNNCDIAYLLDDNGNLISEKHDGKDMEKGKREDCQ